jgi:hypothetical protein
MPGDALEWRRLEKATARETGKRKKGRPWNERSEGFWESIKVSRREPTWRWEG